MTAEVLVRIGRPRDRHPVQQQQRPAEASAQGRRPQAAQGGSRLLAYGLVAIMAVGSIVLWIGIPLAWLWGVSQVSDTYSTVHLMALFGCPITMVLWGLALGRVNLIYLRITDAPTRSRHQTAWLVPMSGEAKGDQPRPVLETLMAISVALAVVTFLVWFFFFAGSSLPAGT